MSFLFDDDNDDIAFSQSFQTSSQRQVTFSQSSSIYPPSQFSSQFSPEKRSQSSYLDEQLALPQQQSQLQSQKQYLSQSSCVSATTQQSHRNEAKFVCLMCGTVDEYYMEGGLATCSRCFTQSQTFKGMEEELDYDEAMHMISRTRDGNVKRENTYKRGTGKSGFNPDGTMKRGRPAVPLEELNRTRKPPSLEECLAGFQTVLQKSCRILCFELMAIPEVRSGRVDQSSDSGDESDGDDSIRHNNHRNSRFRSRERRQELFRQVSKSLKKLWKAYLLSWKEGADHYAELYPQIRFSLRDPFLPSCYRKIVNYTLAARAQETLTEKIRKEVREEEPTGDDDSDSRSDSSSGHSEHSEDDILVRRENKEVNVKLETSDDQGIKTELDLLFDLFHDKVLGSAKVKSEQDATDYHVIVKNESIPVSDRTSDNLHTQNEMENNCVHTDEKCSVASDLFLFDSAEIKSETKISRKLKRVKQKEKGQARSKNTFDKMIYYHNKILKEHTESKTVSVLGRKEAALMLRPSMRLLLGLLLVAASPHGVTEGQMVGWVENGSLPILHAFSTLLSDAQKETLAMTAPFFTLPITPTASNLKRIAKKIHVACEYRPPMSPKPVFLRKPQEPIATDPLDFEPGRLIYPSAVPLILGQLVSDLGFSQKVLNYSLALMGLPVSRLALTKVSASRKRPKTNVAGSSVKDDHNASSSVYRECVQEPSQMGNENGQVEWLPPKLWYAHPDKLSDIHQILAVVIVACKLIPDWESNQRYVFQRGRDFNDSFKVSDRFVPWTQEQFRYIVTGKTESDYLDFLEEYIFRGSNHALPKFVETFNESCVSHIDDHVSGSLDKGNDDSVCDREESEICHRRDNTIVVPNKLVLGWKSTQPEGKSRYCEKRTSRKSTNSRRLYHRTTLLNTVGPLRVDGPLGPLIEYVAMKTETCPDRILEKLIELDKEMVVHGKPGERTCTLPLDLYYHHIFMGQDRPISKEKSKTPIKTRKIQRSPTPSAPTKKLSLSKEKSKRPPKNAKTQRSPTSPAKKRKRSSRKEQSKSGPKKKKIKRSQTQSTTAKKRPSKKEKSKRPSKKTKTQRSLTPPATTKTKKCKDSNSDSDSSWEPNNDDENKWEFVLAQPSPQTDENGRDFILTQRSPLTDESDCNRISDGENDSNQEFLLPLTSSRIKEYEDPVCPFSPSNSVVAYPV